MQFFCYLGALSCIGFYFFNVEYIGLSLIAVFLGSIGFSGTALRQLKALSEATGIQRDELAGMIKMQKKFEMMENQMDISIFGTGKKAKEMQEFVTSMATMGEDQKFEYFENG